ncbi:nuclease-related domain-containing protein [Actinacidiphila sp. DG2A-62]|uniref:nuclease-related domain-containing protein n=1 Tax=Actinacidiphila sp. DG2A-62 TaxID=3108821 RepID=UPI002DB61B8B|nr:nuclease-related domain-containing protein [Actinacidiphila sp. DG2A-62]MEC3995204.1 nuclease-related domain-containing protein [Actinacidiphila sp. DG2A-62]
MVMLLVVAAAVAWYLQAQQRPGAGSSAAAQARRLRSPLVRLAELLGVQTVRGRQAKQWAAGSVGEKRTAARLKPLARQGWTVLHDRALPTGRANVDHLLVSPRGVVVVLDSKKWSARYPLRVVGGRLLHGDRDVSARLDGIRHEARAVSAALGCPVIPLVSMEGPAESPHPRGEWVLDSIRIVPAHQVLAVLHSLDRRYRAAGEHPGPRAAALFPAYRRK